jgi:hypothetical protein
MWGCRGEWDWDLCTSLPFARTLAAPAYRLRPVDHAAFAASRGLDGAALESLPAQISSPGQTDLPSQR